MADPKVKTEPPTLAETSGLTLAEAAKAIADLRVAFETQKVETDKLRQTVVSQEATINKFGVKASRFGQIEIVKRHCNTCGADVEEGGRCPNPKHKRAKVNELGMGTLHNRVQPIIVRQV